MAENLTNRRGLLASAATIGGLSLIAPSANAMASAAEAGAPSPARRDVRTRPNVGSLAADGPQIAALRAGFRVMNSRPGNSPTSLAYQAAIHGNAQAYYYWNQCKHGNWWFLPWHRLYLYYFERILSAASVEAGTGPVDLPYWNWDNMSNAARRAIPAAFRAPDSEAANPLYRTNRNPSLNRPQQPATLPNWDPTWALDRPDFIQTDSAYGFGGRAIGSLSTPQGGHGGQPHGGLEIAPHDYIHSDIGGLMGNPNTAGRDPLFWIHHANLDRLWKVWRRRDPRHVDPTEDTTWMNQDFLFIDEGGNVVSKKVSEALDTEADLGYRYNDDPTDEITHSTRRTPARQLAREARPVPEHEEHAEDPPGAMIASAPSGGAAFALEPATIAVPLAKEADAAIRRYSSARTGAIQLIIEGIKFENPPGATYAVFLNLKDPAHPPCTDDPRFAGIVSFFGLFPHVEAAALDKNAPVPDPTRAPVPTAGGGDFPLIVTDVIRALQELGAWDSNTLKVTLVRRSPVYLGDQPEPAANVAPPQATLERVSLRFVGPRNPR